MHDESFQKSFNKLFVRVIGTDCSVENIVTEDFIFRNCLNFIRIIYRVVIASLVSRPGSKLPKRCHLEG